ncbi:pyrimidine utilization protein D [Paractinoplanes ferrugineus]|uniref:Aminoacrylate hydrolase RutD n=1 Tax=Paractinoplanes ferrugineus TaxID=113564 RepID=A0A919JAM9_9ACTN|nr:alpha/beta hydrolase [Actinoplanes ferrugineus]GIE13671.1 putative aminoacrylate hydrolase RutD [Actinoplanes ferrugineus]
MGTLRQGEQFIEVNGIKLHCHVRGDGPVLLLPSPGWGPAVDYLMPQPALERHCTVVYFDARHSGKSSGPENAEGYTLEHFVADLEALRVHLDVPKVFVAGHSGGGHQALAYGLAHGDHLLGIIAVDAIAAADEVRDREMMKMIDKRRSEPFYRAHPTYVDDAMAAMTGAAGPLTIEQILAKTGAFYFHDPELAAAGLANLEFDDAVLEYSRMAGFQSRNLLAELPRITAPTLIIVGDDDFQCDPVSQAARMHAAMPSSTLEVIADAGHFPWVEQPEAFDAVCDKWFGTLDA